MTGPAVQPGDVVLVTHALPHPFWRVLLHLAFRVPLPPVRYHGEKL